MSAHTYCGEGLRSGWVTAAHSAQPQCAKACGLRHRRLNGRCATVRLCTFYRSALRCAVARAVPCFSHSVRHHLCSARVRFLWQLAPLARTLTARGCVAAHAVGDARRHQLPTGWERGCADHIAAARARGTLSESDLIATVCLPRPVGPFKLCGLVSPCAQPLWCATLCIRSVDRPLEAFLTQRSCGSL
jgi:hypothetical protein